MTRTSTTVASNLWRSGRSIVLVGLAVGLAACDGGGNGSGGRPLTSLPLDGTLGVGGAGAARSSSGHHFVRGGDGAGTTVRLVPGGARWEVYGTGYSSPSAPQYDGTMYVVSTAGGALMEVRGADYATVIALPAAGALFLAKTEDGRLHMLSSAYVDGLNYVYTFWSALPTETTWRNDGSGSMPTTQMWMTSKGRVFGWRRNVGVVLVNPATSAQSTVLACGQPGATVIDCPNLFLSAVPDRRGHFYFASTVDGNGFQTELWRVSDGSSTAQKVAGPGLPQLPQSDGASNYYRPGVEVSLYADPANRIWMSFRWGNNNANDKSFLYRFDGSGWTYVRGDLSRLSILFGEGDNPGILGITLFGSMQVWTLG
ncbi:MAG: hypothetical protein K8S21_13080 [Gemmatimonadetes bacterium]|nr:hypothetical protein [Gemmatimonadota bacterium]